MKNSINVINQRREYIVEYINKVGRTSVEMLAEKLNVSLATIRRDLVFLEEHQLIKKTPYGLYTGSNDIVSFNGYEKRICINQFEKQAIAKLALKFIQNGDFIGMDASTTVIELCKLLPNDIDISLVTNSQLIPFLLMNKPSIQVISTGGVSSPSHASNVGGITNSVISMFHYDKVFISANAFDPNLGICDKSEEIAIKTSFIRAAEKSYLLCDSSKFMKKSLYFTLIRNFDAIITDWKIDKNILKRLQDMGHNILIAPALADETDISPKLG